MKSKAEKRADADKKYSQSKKGKATVCRHEQSEERKATRVRYKQSEKGKIVSTRHRRSEKGKVMNARMHAKRKEYGFEMINDWFEGCEGHHIDKENVLFIPAELHNSIKHEQSNLESMKLINDAAFEWFYIKEVI